MLEGLEELAAKYPALAAVVMACVVWPAITALASLAQDQIKAKMPKLWDFIQRSGFDLLGTIRNHWPKKLPQPPPLPPMGPTIALLALIANSQTSCKPGDAKTAIEVTDAALDVAGQICKEIPSDSKWLKFTCKMIDGASSVIGNTGANNPPGFDREHVTNVEVDPAKLEEFCRANVCHRLLIDE